jgi:hypothetical protein
MEKFLKTRSLERTVISNFEGVLYGKEKGLDLNLLEPGKVLEG